MNHVASHIGKFSLPPDLMAQLSGQIEPQVPRSTMSIRRRLELAFPARIAYRITDVIRPTTDDDRVLLASARTVFNAVWLEPVEDYTEAERRKFVARLNREQRELLDRYDQRGAMTVYRAAHYWLQDLHNREILMIDPDGAFAKCWEGVGEALCGVQSNIDAWNACQRSAFKMSIEWRRWFESRSYYVC